jgi:hypothetical protein
MTNALTILGIAPLKQAIEKPEHLSRERQGSGQGGAPLKQVLKNHQESKGAILK